MIEDQYLWLYRNDVLFRYQRRRELEELIYNRYKPLYVKVVSPNTQVLRLARRDSYTSFPNPILYSMDVRRNCYTPRQSEEIIDWKHEGF